MITDLFWGLIIYLLYRFVFELVIPIAKTVSKMKTTVTKMQEQQEQFHQAQKTATTPPTNSSKGTTTINEEYIDFEEIKD